jgi:hypothetical protein
MTTHAEQADRLQKQYRARVAALNASKDYNDEGKARRIAKLTADHKAEMRELDKADREDKARRERRLLDRTFGTSNLLPSQVVAQRDAADRAQKINTAKEAADALELARFNGDHGLAQEIAKRAFTRAAGHPTISGDWAAVVNKWADDESPAVSEALTELSELHHEQSSHQQRLLRGMRFGVSEPPELKGKNIDQLAAAADREDSTASEPQPQPRRMSREDIFGTHFTPEAS